MPAVRFASLAAWLIPAASAAAVTVDSTQADDAFCALQTKKQLQTAVSSNSCTDLTGVYHDLHDGDNKIISVTAGCAMTITPPLPGSEYYVEGVGQDWIVPPRNIGPITADGVVTSIDFRVQNKPNPPDEEVSGRFKFTELMKVSWISDCGPATVGSDACGQCGADPVRSLEGPQHFLLFGTSLTDAGNVWVKIAA